MPWTNDNPPDVAKNWTAAEQARCVSAGNSVLEKDGTDAEAIQACIAAAGKSERKAAGDTFNCECLECGHTITSAEHCADITCPECNGQMRRAERPGPGKALKAGKRLAAGKLDALQGAIDALQEILKWARYNDGMIQDGSAGALLKIKALKSTTKGVVVGSYMALWGNPDKRDLHKDYFTPDTRFFLDHYKAAPALFHHGMDDQIGKAVIGQRDDARKDADGLWVQDWLDRSSKFWGLVEPLLDAGTLYYSPGAAPHLVERTKDRQIKAFPIVDDTLTLTPIQIHLRDRPIEYIKAAYAAAGQEFTLPESLREKGVEAPLTSDDREEELQLALGRLALTRKKYQV